VRLRLSRNSLKLKVSTRIPAQLVGGTGVTITKANGIYTFDMDETEIADIATVAAEAAVEIGVNVQAYDADLTAVAALSGTGIARRTGSNTWTVGTAVANSELATMAAYTVKGNATGSSAVPTDISIPALTQKATPVSADKIMMADSAASNALKYATLSSVASALSVSSLGGCAKVSPRDVPEVVPGRLSAGDQATGPSARNAKMTRSLRK